MLPNFLIIGASRCGTTWMAKNLKMHPDIYMPAKKELDFFNRDFDKGWDYYSSYFPCEKCRLSKAVGEASPAYLYFSQVPGLIERGIPDVKLIVSLRNPIDRAYSHYWNLYAAAPEGHVNKRLTFEEKIEFTPRLVDEGFYAEKLNSYYKLFSREKILVLIFEEMVEDPVATFKEIHKFLGVDTNFIPPLRDIKINSASSKLGRSRLLYYTSKAFYRIVRIPFLSSRIDSVNARQLPDIHPVTQQKLREKYAPHVSELEAMLNKDLSVWGIRR